MKKRIALMLAALMCVNTMAACGTGTTTDTTDTPQKEEQETTEKQPEQETVGDDVTVNIWHDGDETIMQTIADEVNESLAADHITVQFEKKTVF